MYSSILPYYPGYKTNGLLLLIQGYLALWKIELVASFKAIGSIIRPSEGLMTEWGGLITVIRPPSLCYKANLWPYIITEPEVIVGSFEKNGIFFVQKKRRKNGKIGQEKTENWPITAKNLKALQVCKAILSRLSLIMLLRDKKS